MYLSSQKMDLEKIFTKKESVYGHGRGWDVMGGKIAVEKGST